MSNTGADVLRRACFLNRYKPHRRNAMELLVLLFALAMLVWLALILRRGRYSAVAMAVLGVGTVFGPPFFAFDGPIQFSLDRMLWAMMLCLSLVGWRLGSITVPQLRRVDWLVAAIVAWFLVSCLRGGPGPTGSSPLARWMFYIAMPAGMYGFARLLQVNRVDVRWLGAAVITLGCYLALTGLLEVSGLHAWVFPRFIANPQSWEFFGRARGPLMNPAGNGIVLSIAAVAAAVGIAQGNRHTKVLCGATLILIFAGIYATMTRSVWLGAIGAIAAALFWFTPRWARALGLVSVIIFGTMALVGVKQQLLRMERDKHLSAADAEKSIELRPLLAVVAWEMFQDRPLGGHGFGHYVEKKVPYHSDRSYGLPLEQARNYVQHNVFLSIAVDTGLVGILLFGGWLCCLLSIGCQLARHMPADIHQRAVGLVLLGTLVAYGCNGLFHDVLIIPMVHMYLFFVAGITVNVHQHGVQTSSVRPATAIERRQPLQLAH